jgi:hypothetical protein
MTWKLDLVKTSTVSVNSYPNNQTWRLTLLEYLNSEVDAAPVVMTTAEAFSQLGEDCEEWNRKKGERARLGLEGRLGLGQWG